MSRERKPLNYEVTDSFGTVHAIVATTAFDANGTIVFRLKDEAGDHRTVASFAPGFWAGYVVKSESEQADQ